MRYTYLLHRFRPARPAPMRRWASVVAAAEQLGFAGLNVTHPFKQSVIAASEPRWRPRRRRSAPSTPSSSQAACAQRPQHRQLGLCRELSRRAWPACRAGPRRAVRRRRRGCRGRACAARTRRRRTARSSISDAGAGARSWPTALTARFGATRPCRDRRRGGARGGRRHRQRHARGHGEISRHAVSLPACSRRATGWPTSSISRRRRNCCSQARRAGLPHARRAPAWRSTRRSAPSSCSPAGRPTAQRWPAISRLRHDRDARPYRMLLQGRRA